jgi:tetratricopeptide (TPR) repeat protein
LNATKICLIVLVLASTLASQSLRPVRGEISADTTTDLSWLTVRLDLSGSHERGATAQVSVSGSFMFSGVADGLYTLRVMNTADEEIVSQAVTVGAFTPPVSLELPKSLAERPTGETTSVAQLQHRPNRKALAAARRGQKFSESGDYERSAAEWEKAVEADPEFSEAHGNLGAQYARLKRSTEAVDEFRKAIALDRSTARHQSNLAVALAQLGRYEEAESWARSAVRMDGSEPLGHYVLGCVLTARRTKAAEAIQQFQIAARQIPRAHQLLADIYHAQGREELAAAERKQFQEASEAPKDHQADSWRSPLR